MKGIGERNNMEEWKEYKLYEIADVQTGPFGSQLHNEDYVPEGTPIVTVEHLGSRKFTYQNLPKVSEKDRLRLSKYTMSIGDIIFSRVGSVDRCSYVDLESNGWMFSGRCLRIHVLNQDEVNTLFLYYYFCIKEIKQHLRNIAVGATMPSLNTKLLNNINICIPSKECQDAIAKILGSIDDKIELNNRINANLEEQTQALFRRWFVDFEFPNEQGLPYKSNGGTFVDSELGKIPEEWKVGNLFSVATLFDSKRKPLSNIQRASRKGEYPYYGATSVMDYVDDYLFDGTFLLMGEDGSVVNEQGYPFLQYVTGKFWVNNHAHIMQGKNGFSTEMLYCMMKMTNISNLVTGAVQAKLSQTNMNKILFPLATKDILKYFSIMIEPLYALLRKNVYENQTLIQLRDLLLPKLMSGETIWSINY